MTRSHPDYVRIELDDLELSLSLGFEENRHSKFSIVPLTILWWKEDSRRAKNALIQALVTKVVVAEDDVFLKTSLWEEFDLEAFERFALELHEVLDGKYGFVRFLSAEVKVKIEIASTAFGYAGRLRLAHPFVANSFTLELSKQWGPDLFLSNWCFFCTFESLCSFSRECDELIESLNKAMASSLSGDDGVNDG